VPDGGEDERAGRLRRAWRHRPVQVVVVLLAVTLVAGTATVGRFVYRYNQVDREKVEGLEASESSEPQNFLLVGSDSRAFVEGGDEEAAFGTEAEVGAPHADTILLVRTFPDTDRVAMVSFPRDLYLPIAGTGGEDRINAAVQGGADRLVATIAENFGIPVHRFAQIDFQGFQGLVDAIDGVTIPFPAPVRDFDREKGSNPTGLDVPNPGCVRLNGGQALAYVRARHYEQLIEGVWQPDPAGDLNRIQRQQDFIRRTFHQTLAKGLLDPRRIDRLLGVAIDNVTLDDGLGWRDLQDLIGQFRSLTPDSLQTYVLPTSPQTTPAGAQVLRLDAAAAEPIFDVFRGVTDEPATTLASTIRVQVLNASGRSGAVRAAAFRLAAAGFSVPNVGELPVRLDRTRLRVGTGQEQAAEVVAARLSPRPEVVGDPTILGVDVVLDIGRDWDRVLDPEEAAAVAAATTTTSTTASTTTSARPGAPPSTEPAPTTTAAPEPEGLPC
jgi:polyisoprenyl-teichoic acid--peptidoglycan teichoic acid transferase